MTPHAGSDGLLAGIEASTVGELMRGSTWLYPTVEVTHIIGFVLLVGGIVLVDLRLLGFGRRLPVDDFLAFSLRSVVLGLLLALPSGLLLFTAEAVALARNPMMQLKLALIALGLVNAALFTFGPMRRAGQWRQSASPPAAQIAGAVSLLTWVGALICGRLIAYL